MLITLIFRSAGKNVGQRTYEGSAGPLPPKDSLIDLSGNGKYVATGRYEFLYTLMSVSVTIDVRPY